MKGGKPRFMPKYQVTNIKTNIPNEQKQIYQKNLPQQKEYPPTLSVEYRQPPPSKKKHQLFDKPFDEYAYTQYSRPDVISSLNYQNHLYNPNYMHATHDMSLHH